MYTKYQNVSPSMALFDIKKLAQPNNFLLDLCYLVIFFQHLPGLITAICCNLLWQNIYLDGWIILHITDRILEYIDESGEGGGWWNCFAVLWSYCPYLLEIVISISRNALLKSCARFIIERSERRKKQHDFKSVHFKCRMVLFYTIWEKSRL